MRVRIRDLEMSYPGVTLFHRLSLSLADGEIVCLLGPSGSDKITLLNILAGSVHPSGGEITPRTAGRVSYLFQESRLLHRLTVLENTIYLMDDGIPLESRREKGMVLIEKLGLGGFEHRYPDELSGGMARRAALGRMLGRNAGLILMDEPFSSLDGTLRGRLADLTGRLLREENSTALCVTHDESAARGLGDRIIRFVRAEGRTFIA